MNDVPLPDPSRESGVIGGGLYENMPGITGNYDNSQFFDQTLAKDCAAPRRDPEHYQLACSLRLLRYELTNVDLVVPMGGGISTLQAQKPIEVPQWAPVQSTQVSVEAPVVALLESPSESGLPDLLVTGGLGGALYCLTVPGLIPVDVSFPPLPGNVESIIVLNFYLIAVITSHESRGLLHLLTSPFFRHTSDTASCSIQPCTKVLQIGGEIVGEMIAWTSNGALLWTRIGGSILWMLPLPSLSELGEGSFTEALNRLVEIKFFGRCRDPRFASCGAHITATGSCGGPRSVSVIGTSDGTLTAIMGLSLSTTLELPDCEGPVQRVSVSQDGQFVSCFTEAGGLYLAQIKNDSVHGQSFGFTIVRGQCHTAPDVGLELQGSVAVCRSLVYPGLPVMSLYRTFPVIVDSLYTTDEGIVVAGVRSTHDMRLVFTIGYASRNSVWAGVCCAQTGRAWYPNIAHPSTGVPLVTLWCTFTPSCGIVGQITGAFTASNSENFRKTTECLKWSLRHQIGFFEESRQGLPKEFMERAIAYLSQHELQQNKQAPSVFYSTSQRYIHGSGQTDDSGKSYYYAEYVRCLYQTTESLFVCGDDGWLSLISPITGVSSQLTRLRPENKWSKGAYAQAEPSLCELLMASHQRFAIATNISGTVFLLEDFGANQQSLAMACVSKLRPFTRRWAIPLEDEDDASHFVSGHFSPITSLAPASVTVAPVRKVVDWASDRAPPERGWYRDCLPIYSRASPSHHLLQRRIATEELILTAPLHPEFAVDTQLGQFVTLMADPLSSNGPLVLFDPFSSHWCYFSPAATQQRLSDPQGQPPTTPPPRVLLRGARLMAADDYFLQYHEISPYIYPSCLRPRDLTPRLVKSGLVPDASVITAVSALFHPNLVLSDLLPLVQSMLDISSLGIITQRPAPPQVDTGVRDGVNYPTTQEEVTSFMSPDQLQQHRVEARSGSVLTRSTDGRDGDHSMGSLTHTHQASSGGSVAQFNFSNADIRDTDDVDYMVTHDLQLTPSGMNTDTTDIRANSTGQAQLRDELTDMKDDSTSLDQSNPFYGFVSRQRADSVLGPSDALHAWRVFNKMRGMAETSVIELLSDSDSGSESDDEAGPVFRSKSMPIGRMQLFLALRLLPSVAPLNGTWFPTLPAGASQKERDFSIVAALNPFPLSTAFNYRVGSVVILFPDILKDIENAYSVLGKSARSGLITASAQFIHLFCKDGKPLLQRACIARVTLVRPLFFSVESKRDRVIPMNFVSLEVLTSGSPELSQFPIVSRLIPSSFIHTGEAVASLLLPYVVHPTDVAGLSRTASDALSSQGDYLPSPLVPASVIEAVLANAPRDSTGLMSADQRVWMPMPSFLPKTFYTQVFNDSSKTPYQKPGMEWYMTREDPASCPDIITGVIGAMASCISAFSQGKNVTLLPSQASLVDHSFGGNVSEYLTRLYDTQFLKMVTDSHLVVSLYNGNYLAQSQRTGQQRFEFVSQSQVERYLTDQELYAVNILSSSIAPYLTRDDTFFNIKENIGHIILASRALLGQFFLTVGGFFKSDRELEVRPGFLFAAGKRNATLPYCVATALMTAFPGRDPQSKPVSKPTSEYARLLKNGSRGGDEVLGDYSDGKGICSLPTSLDDLQSCLYFTPFGFEHPVHLPVHFCVSSRVPLSIATILEQNVPSSEAVTQLGSRLGIIALFTSLNLMSSASASELLPPDIGKVPGTLINSSNTVVRPTLATLIWRLAFGYYLRRDEVYNDLASITDYIFCIHFGGVLPEQVVKAALETEWSGDDQDIFEIRGLQDMQVARTMVECEVQSGEASAHQLLERNPFQSLSRVIPVSVEKFQTKCQSGSQSGGSYSFSLGQYAAPDTSGMMQGGIARDDGLIQKRCYGITAGSANSMLVGPMPEEPAEFPPLVSAVTSGGVPFTGEFLPVRLDGIPSLRTMRGSDLRGTAPHATYRAPSNIIIEQARSLVAKHSDVKRIAPLAARLKGAILSEEGGMRSVSPSFDNSTPIQDINTNSNEYHVQAKINYARIAEQCDEQVNEGAEEKISKSEQQSADVPLQDFTRKRLRRLSRMRIAQLNSDLLYNALKIAFNTSIAKSNFAEAFQRDLMQLFSSFLKQRQGIKQFLDRATRQCGESAA